MAEEKPGFFKRIFSFGRKAKEEALAAAAEAEAVIAAEPVTAPDKAEPEPVVREERPPEPEQAAEEPKPAPRPVEAAAAPAVTEAAFEPEPEPKLEPAPEPEPEPEPEALVLPEPEALPVPAPAPQPVAAAREDGWFRRLAKGLSRSSASLAGNIAAVFTKRKLDDATLEELEDVLIQADLGVATAARIASALSAQRYGCDVSDEEVRQVMAAEIEKTLSQVALPLELDLSHRPHVILVVGVNGSGKTTTIGKLTAKLRAAGHSVVLAAGDTFRAAAIEQLKIWGERNGAPVIAREVGADAASLAFEALAEARSRNADVMIMDTAGRLQNRAELMAELEKVIRVLKKQDETAPHTVLLTLDATTGQNALQQVEIFGKVAGVTGLVMTKLDGTARGGILVAIADKHRLPVHFIGVGEQVDDLEPFEAADFARSIAGLPQKAEALQ